MTRKRHFIIAAGLAVAGSWAWGQTVYRCGSSYGQQPCAGGVAMESSDARSPAEASRAASVAAADARRADAMEKARLAQEKNAPKAVIIGPQAAASAPESRPVNHGTKAKAGKLEQFTAVSPRKPGEKKKPKKKKKKDE
jgi:hypothetical protein